MQAAAEKREQELAKDAPRAVGIDRQAEVQEMLRLAERELMLDDDEFFSSTPLPLVTVPRPVSQAAAAAAPTVPAAEPSPKKKKPSRRRFLD